METSSNQQEFAPQIPLMLLGGEMFSEPPVRLKRRRITDSIQELLDKDDLDLSLPLFDMQGDVAILYDHEDEDIQVGVLSYMDGMVSTNETEKEVRPEWTSDEITRLHGVLLDESIKALGGKGNEGQKRDILNWMFEADFYADRQETGGKVIFTVDIPWTFTFCCKLANEDPDVYRDYIRSRLARA